MKRESNFDLLRIISTIGIILLHVSGEYVECAINEKQMLIVFIYNNVIRFAVPCFFMLSGAFALSNEKNTDYKSYYKKIGTTIYRPAIVASVLYILQDIGRNYKATGAFISIEIIRNAVIGLPRYHLWYIYTAIGLYLVVPFLVHILNTYIVQETTQIALAIILLVWTGVSGLTSHSDLYWAFGNSMNYLGYFLMGYVLRKVGGKKKNNIQGIICIISAICGMLALSVIAEKLYIGEYEVTALVAEVFSILPFGPFIIIFSILLFYGFAKLNIRMSFDFMSRRMFIVYLYHIMVLEFINKFLMSKFEMCIEIPIKVLLVFIFSMGISIIYFLLFERQLIWKRKTI